MTFLKNKKYIKWYNRLTDKEKKEVKRILTITNEVSKKEKITEDFLRKLINTTENRSKFMILYNLLYMEYNKEEVEDFWKD